MAITIKEIFSSDTIADLISKTNFNFDQLLLSGGGPIGPLGNTGPIGPGGPAGRRGENTYFDDGTGIGSAPLIGNIIGDQFVLGNGDVYEWDGASWLISGTNLKGPTGATGAAGTSVDIKRWIGGFGSTFPVGVNWYPQGPVGPTGPSGDIDFITLRQGGLDNFFLGDAEIAYGISGANSGIANFPNKNNSAKLWIIQNSLVGGGLNGLTIGAIGAKESTDPSSYSGNYNQFGHIYLDNSGNMNIRITAGGISLEPKNIFLTTDGYVSIQAGDVLNNQFSVGKDPLDSLIGIFGNLKDKIDLTSENIILKAKSNLSITLDSDGGNTGISEFIKANIPVVNPVIKDRIISIKPTLGISNDSNHYSDGISISSGTGSGKVELFLFGTKTILTLGAQKGSVNEGKNLMILDNGKVLISPTVSYPLTPISGWINNVINDGLTDGSLSIYGQLRINNNNSPQNGILYSDSNGVIGYGTSSGIPGNSTNFILGLWGREVAQNRIYPFSTSHFVNIGTARTDDTESLLVLSKSNLSTRKPQIVLKSDSLSDRGAIIFDNTFRSKLQQANNIDGNREYNLPKSIGQGGIIMVMSDNNGQFNDSWEEYQKLREDASLITDAAVLLKDQIKLNAFGARTGGYSTNITDLNKLIIASGIDWFTVSGGKNKERRYPSKIHLKRINKDFYFLKFSITLFVEPNSFSSLAFEQFNFFEFTFNGTLPGELQNFRSDINDIDDPGAAWYSGAAYQTALNLTFQPTVGPVTITNFRRDLVTNATSYGLANFNIGFSYDMQWCIERLGANTSRIQILCKDDIMKLQLRNGITFTGNAIVYGKTV